MKKAIVMISGGIDSPLAAKIMMEEYEVIPVHFVLHPFYCKGSFDIAVETMKSLGFKKVILFPFGKILGSIAKEEKFYQCIMCRKSMFKAAEILAEKYGAEAIITGESLAQKASQTLKNMAATTYGLKIPVLHPLLSMDKEEIITLSKKFGIYREIHTGCCTVTPIRPVTRAEIEEAEMIFEDLELEDDIKKAMKKVIYDKPSKSLLKKLI
ncbi:MAG: hypothetical protein KJ906_01740 [Nanoarchaeota archaeon]|nr:hypothetical protein [Nanoarchaeota archaeon]